jgi:hypothetical protein
VINSHDRNRLRGLASKPHIFFTLVSLGVIVGSLASILAGTFRLRSALLVWTGCAVLVQHAWRTKPGWTEVFRSRAFWIGVALTVAGNAIAAQADG